MDLIGALDRLLSTLGIATDVTRFLVIFLLGMARMLGAITLNPFIGGASVPPRARVGLAVIVTGILFPFIGGGAGEVPPGSLTVFALLVKEIMIGVTIGLISQFIFYAVQMAGTIIDTQRGMNQATFFSPQLPGNVSVLGQLKFQAALVLFLTINGHLLFLRALADSFETLEVLTFPQFQVGLQAVGDQVIRLSAGTFVVALQLSAPVLIVLFMVDVAFGVIGKIAPQINVHTESQPVKAFVGLILVLLTIGLVMARLTTHFTEMIQQVYNLVRLFV